MAPARIWYNRTTGIWQPVWIEAVGQTYISNIAWTPDPRRGRLAISVRLNREPERPLRAHLRLENRGQVLADDTYLIRNQETEREMRLEPDSGGLVGRRLLWSPGQPNLIDADIVLLDVSENSSYELDRVRSYVGLRSIEADDGLYLINGRPTYLRLVLAQNYWPESHLAAPSDVAIRREVELIRTLGFNGVRIHQKVEDERFLYWCDRLGLLVWAEMANAYEFTETAVDRFTREWIEVVRRQYSHPSIITWVPFNESWGVPDLPGDEAQRNFVRAIYHLTKAIDRTRRVVGNDGWEQVAGDIWGVHDYALDGAALRDRWGTVESEAVPGQPWFGYGSVRSDDELLSKYEELVSAVLDSPALAGFCYTQLTDTEQEANGLLRADRTPKLDPEIIRAITARPSRAIPGDFIAEVQNAGMATAGDSNGWMNGAERNDAEDFPDRQTADAVLLSDRPHPGQQERETS